MGLRKKLKKVTKSVTKVAKKAVQTVAKNPALAIAVGGVALGGFAALPALTKGLKGGGIGGLFSSFLGGGGKAEEQQEVAIAQEEQAQATADMYPGVTVPGYPAQAAQVPAEMAARRAPRRGGFLSWLFG